MIAVVDAGGLIVVHERDRVVGAMLRVLPRDGGPVITSAAVVAQAWRDPRRQVNVVRVLTGVDIAALDDVAANKVGELVRANGTGDLADAHLELLVQPQDRVLTSDEDDITALLRTRRVNAVAVRV